MTYREIRPSGATQYGHGVLPSDLDRLENLDEYEIAENETDPRGFDVIGQNGEEIGTIRSLLSSPTTEKAYLAIVDTGGWFANRQYAVPLEYVDFNQDRREARIPFTREQFRNAPEFREGDRDFQACYSYWEQIEAGAGAAAPAETRMPAERGRAREAPPEGEELHVPLMEETASVRRERREVGYLTVRKRQEIERRHISEPVTRVDVTTETRDVPVGEQYQYGPGTTPLREGETLRVPVVEEELVVEKTPRVTREVIVHAEPHVEQEERDVELIHEEVDVSREGETEFRERPERGRRAA